jgi:hypothetical protein
MFVRGARILDRIYKIYRIRFENLVNPIRTSLALACAVYGIEHWEWQVRDGIDIGRTE